MLKVEHAAIACFAALQSFAFVGLPVSAAQNCGPNRHWVQTGAGYGSGYCKRRRGGIIKFVLSAITTKAVAFVSAMEIGGKGVDLLIGGLAMNLKSHKVALHFRGQTVEIFE